MKQIGLIICLLVSTSFGFSQGEWNLAKEKNGIKVYTREKANYNIKEFKAVTQEVDANFEKVCATLLDTDNGEKWIADTEEATLLSVESETKTTAHYLLSLPWPIDARDMVLDNTISKKDKELFITMKSVPKKHPVQEDVLRMQNAEGSWKITKRESGKISIDYRFIGDPGGNLPAWVINLFIVDGPLNTISNLLEVSK